MILLWCLVWTCFTSYSKYKKKKIWRYFDDVIVCSDLSLICKFYRVNMIGNLNINKLIPNTYKIEFTTLILSAVLKSHFKWQEIAAFINHWEKKEKMILIQLKLPSLGFSNTINSKSNLHFHFTRKFLNWCFRISTIFVTGEIIVEN